MIIFERFEDDKAVLEINGEIKKVSCDKISSDVSEGDVLVEENGSFNVDKDGTEKRRQEILKLQNSLWG